MSWLLAWSGLVGGTSGGVGDDGEASGFCDGFQVGPRR